ncbi:MAG TPA: cation diffusion facilitator family transporter [Microthrixaceae bacterium]|nr:cation diffusion facilitator family transporter [Microthrixaceae bacterium]
MSQVESGHSHGGGHSHSGHSHAGHSHAGQGSSRTALVGALGANSVLLVVQVVVGLLIGSLSLLADSLHNASDVAALAIALIGQVMAARPATDRHSYGLARAEVLAALLNGTVLVAITGWVIFEAFGRLGQAPEIDALPLGIVGAVGLAVNGISAWALSRTGSGNLNIRAAFWHLVADALGSVGVIIAAVGIGVFGVAWADPVASLLISLLVLAGVVRLLRDTVFVLLETTPTGLDPTEVHDSLAAVGGVVSVHHLHIWSIDTEQTALTAHLTMADEVDLHQAQIAANKGREVLAEKFGITHATLEIECHECVEPEHGDLNPIAAKDSHPHEH